MTESDSIAQLKAVQYELTIADEAKSLLLSQYENSENLKHYLVSIVEPMEAIKHGFEEIVRLKNLNVMVGDQLDMVGEVVGLERVIRGADPSGFFGYYEHSQSDVLGDETTRPDLEGGFFKSEFDKDGKDFHMADDFYQRAIRARIVKLHSKCTMEDIYTFVCLIANSQKFELWEADREIHVKYHGRFNIGMRAVMAILLPEMKPVGIQMFLEDLSGNIALNAAKGIK